MSNPHTAGWTPLDWHDYLEGIAEDVLADRERRRRRASRDAREREIDRALGRSLRRMRKRGIYTGPRE